MEKTDSKMNIERILDEVPEKKSHKLRNTLLFAGTLLAAGAAYVIHQYNSLLDGAYLPIGPLN